MSDCGESYSVMSRTFNYLELCARSHEFLRRACTKTPTDVVWAGDLLVSTGSVLKQSEVNDMRGGSCVLEHEYSAPHEDCGTTTVGLPPQYTVKDTLIRTGGRNSFNYTIQKAVNEDDEKNWDLNIYQSLNDCGILMDGGDVLYRPQAIGRVLSLCGTIDRELFNPTAYFLDNRITTEDDADKGLLFVIRDGLTATHEVRWVDEQVLLQTGLEDAANITEQFKAALTAKGITENQVLSFGMI